MNIVETSIIGKQALNDPYFKRRDVNLLESSKYKEKLVHFNYNAPVPFRLIFTDNQKFAIKQSSGYITFVCKQNYSRINEIPLTPWIVAHRFGHAISRLEAEKTPIHILYRSDEWHRDYILKRANINPTSRNLFWGHTINDSELYVIYDESSLKFIKDPSMSLGSPTDVSFQDVYYCRLANRICTFASARNNMIISSLDFFAELVAQYLVTGNVKFTKNFDPDGKHGQLLDSVFNDLLEWCVDKEFCL